MHRPAEGPRFFFNAYASGFSGRITKPFNELIETQASCALSPSGGYASAQVKDFRFKQILSFASASTQVTGDEHAEEKAWNQVVTSTVEDIDILGQFTAKKIVAVMSIKRGFYEEFPVFRIIGCRVEGLFVGGEPVEVDFNQNIDTWDAAVREFSPKEPPKGNIILGTAVQNMKAARMVDRNVIDVPDFGRVILGEYLITPYARSLSIFRVEMGCGNEGEGGGGNVGGNGSRMPPYP